MATGAWRLANGELPYRDFWATYPPGQYYVLALLFRLFGPTVLLGRIYGAAVHLAMVALGSYLSGLLGGRPTAVLTWLLLTLLLGPSELPLYPAGPAIVMGLLSCFLACRSIPKPTAARLLLAGGTVGITCLFRYDYGLYAFLAGSVALSAAGRAGLLSSVLRRWLLYSCGVAAIVIPAAGLLLTAIKPGILYQLFVDFPIHVYPRFRGLPYPLPFPQPAEVRALTESFSGFTLWLALVVQAFRKLVFYFPLVALGAAAAELWLQSKPQQGKPSADPRSFPSGCLLASLAVFCAGGLNSVRVRPDLPHMEAPLAIALTFAPLLLVSIGRTGYPLRLALILLGASMAVHGGLSGVARLSERGGAMLRQGTLPRTRGIWLVTEADRALEEAIVFLHATVPAGERVFAGNTRHDSIVMNDVLFYFLIERPPATRYHELHPGVATTDAVQEEIIGELQTGRVGHLLLFDGGTYTEPNDSRRPGSRLLDDFIRARFHPIRQFGPYSVWKANPSSAPAD